MRWKVKNKKTTSEPSSDAVVGSGKSKGIFGRFHTSKTNTSDTKGGVKYFGAKKPTGKKQKILIAAGAVLAVLLVVGLVNLLKSEDEPEQNKSEIVCIGTLRQQAAANLNPISPEKINDLATTVTEIEKLPNYKEDQNCLYPVTWYYIFTGDPEKAKDNYAALAEVYDEATLYEDFTFRLNLEETKAELDALNTTVKEAQDNSLYSSPPPEGQ